MISKLSQNYECHQGWNFRNKKINEFSEIRLLGKHLAEIGCEKTCIDIELNLMAALILQDVVACHD